MVRRGPVPVSDASHHRMIFSKQLGSLLSRGKELTEKLEWVRVSSVFAIE